MTAEIFAPGIISGDAFEHSRFLAPGEVFIVYSSIRAGSAGGSINLYVTFLTPDGKFFFFLRNDPYGASSFYWIDAAMVPKVK